MPALVVFASALVGLVFIGRRKWWGWLFSMTSYGVWAIDQAIQGQWVYVVMGLFFTGLGAWNLRSWLRGG